MFILFSVVLLFGCSKTNSNNTKESQATTVKQQVISMAPYNSLKPKESLAKRGKRSSLDASSQYATVSGQAYLVLGSGDSQILRGLQVYLIQNTQELKEKQQRLAVIKERILLRTNEYLSKANILITSKNQLGISKVDIEDIYSRLIVTTGFAKQYMIKAKSFYANSTEESTKVDINGEYTICLLYTSPSPRD